MLEFLKNTNYFDAINAAHIAIKAISHSNKKAAAVFSQNLDHNILQVADNILSEIEELELISIEEMSYSVKSRYISEIEKISSSASRSTAKIPEKKAMALLKDLRTIEVPFS